MEKETFFAIALPDAAWDPWQVRSFDLILVEAGRVLPEHPAWLRPVLDEGVYMTLAPQHLN